MHFATQVGSVFVVSLFMGVVRIANQAEDDEVVLKLTKYACTNTTCFVPC